MAKKHLKLFVLLAFVGGNFCGAVKGQSTYSNRTKAAAATAGIGLGGAAISELYRLIQEYRFNNSDRAYDEDAVALHNSSMEKAGLARNILGSIGIAGTLGAAYSGHQDRNRRVVTMGGMPAKPAPVKQEDALNVDRILIDAKKEQNRVLGFLEKFSDKENLMKEVVDEINKHLPDRTEYVKTFNKPGKATQEELFKAVLRDLEVKPTDTPALKRRKIALMFEVGQALQEGMRIKPGFHADIAAGVFFGSMNPLLDKDQIHNVLVASGDQALDLSLQEFAYRDTKNKMNEKSFAAQRAYTEIQRRIDDLKKQAVGDRSLDYAEHLELLEKRLKDIKRLYPDVREPAQESSGGATWTN